MPLIIVGYLRGRRQFFVALVIFLLATVHFVVESGRNGQFRRIHHARKQIRNRNMVLIETTTRSTSTTPPTSPTDAPLGESPQGVLERGLERGLQSENVNLGLEFDAKVDQGALKAVVQARKPTDQERLPPLQMAPDIADRALAAGGGNPSKSAVSSVATFWQYIMFTVGSIFLLGLSGFIGLVTYEWARTQPHPTAHRAGTLSDPTEDENSTSSSSTPSSIGETLGREEMSPVGQQLTPKQVQCSTSSSSNTVTQAI